MTKPYYQDDQGVTLYHGDCIEVMRSLPDASVHAVVTDPPYGLEFMGREWDGADGFRRSLNAADVGRESVYGRTSGKAPEFKAGKVFQDWCELWAAEALRVLKPGGFLLAFGGTRTWHRLQTGIEDAGFEIRASMAWLYGSGFPKSMDIAKAITGAELGFGSNSSAIRKATLGEDYTESGRLGNRDGAGRRDTGMLGKALDLSEAAKAWEGWGTALKPGHEPIVVARKPIAGTVAANVLAHGTGAMNIAASRVGEEKLEPVTRGVSRIGTFEGIEGIEGKVTAERTGRWPTDVILDSSQAAALDQHTGILTSGKMQPTKPQPSNRKVYGQDATAGYETMETYGDSGGASRFFSTFDMSAEDWATELAMRDLPTFRYEAKAPGSERPDVDGTEHPTVKPLALMRYLVNLVTMPGGTVLEPFAGSGTTLEACLLDGFNVIGIEREETYLPLIMQRIKKPLQQSLFGDIA